MIRPDSYDPTAPRDNTVCLGHARFTFLTERMIRLEWADDGHFEDRASLSVVNRRMPKVDYTAEQRDTQLTLTTDALTLTYNDDGKPFSKSNLRVSFSMNDKAVTWHPGKPQRGNLKGTARTLDGVEGGKVQLGDGLISRDGWAMVDDSQTIVLEDRPGTGPWIVRRDEGTRQDLYLLAYGHAYTDALHDGALVFGRQPLPPRWTLGYWWSRFWAYTDREFEGLVEQFDRRELGLDVMVVDMDWHLPGWTGYTWDRRYFPDPDEFLAWLKERDLKITLNLHPADGIGAHEDAFEDVARAMGQDPETCDRVPFDCTDPHFMQVYFRKLHHPEENRGVDFWWMDWQQGTGSSMPGLDPLPWLNHLHWHDLAERHPAKRPIVFSRFGGIGSGRHPVGFSGDTKSVWPSLAYQPYFTATASNVLFGYWSHDIGGHMPGDIEPELYTRWIQFGIHSPILRTHTTRNEDAERRVWEYPDPYSAVMEEAIRRRYEMVPYIYTENRRAWDNGVSLCRPMYYDWPDENEAYRATGQYLFGRQMLVAPVTSPRDETTELATVRVWLPEGQWVDTATGEMLEGGRTVRRNYLLQEIPVFVRGGTLVPGQPPVTRLCEGSYPDLVVTAYPGGEGRYDLYEDDGVSEDYQRGRFATIPLHQRSGAASHEVTVGPAKGRYRGFKKLRSLEVRLAASVPPARVMVGGKQLDWSHRPCKQGWWYDGDAATVVVRLRKIDLAEATGVVLRFGKSADRGTACGFKGLVARLDEVRRYVTYVSGALPDDRLAAEVAQVGNRISRRPETFAQEMVRLHEALPRLLKMLPILKRKQSTPRRKGWMDTARALLKDAIGQLND